MNRLIALSLVLAASGCAAGPASIPSSASASQRERIDIDVAGGRGTVETDRLATATSAPLSVPQAKVWPLLAQVYSQLGLPVTTIDPGTFVVGVQNQRVRTIGGKPVRSYFDCGLGYVTAGRDVYVLVRTQLKAGASGGTVAQTQVDAFAKSNESSGGTRCGSSGALETLIAERLRDAVQAKYPE